MLIRASMATHQPELPAAIAFDRAKAQMCAESAFNPNARSGVGAEGLYQFMPGTWGDVAKARHYPPGTSPLEVEAAIDGYGFYMAQLRRFWRVLPDPDRHWHAAASYNAGAGWIRKAARACGGSSWSITAPCLAAITGRANARQTTDYVRRIQTWSAP